MFFYQPAVFIAWPKCQAFFIEVKHESYIIMNMRNLNTCVSVFQ